MASFTPDPDFVSDEITPLQPEALLRFVLLLTPDARAHRPFGVSLWVDKATVLGSHYRCGKQHAFTFVDDTDESGTYVSALPPRLERVALPHEPPRSLPALTVFLATPELFEQLDQAAAQQTLAEPGELAAFAFPE